MTVTQLHETGKLVVFKSGILVSQHLHVACMFWKDGVASVVAIPGKTSVFKGKLGIGSIYDIEIACLV